MSFSVCKNMDEVLKKFLDEAHEEKLSECEYCHKPSTTFKYLVTGTSRTTKNICKQCHSENSMWLEEIK
jgi:predicted CXXCH cytochrome family protein